MVHSTTKYRNSGGVTLKVAIKHINHSDKCQKIELDAIIKLHVHSPLVEGLTGLAPGSVVWVVVVPLPPAAPAPPPPFFFLAADEGLVGDLSVTNSLISCLISPFSGSFRSGNPSRSAGDSIFLVVALARCESKKSSKLMSHPIILSGTPI